MAKLPKLDSPIFELTLFSTGEKIQYRPFRLKEEKILLIAQESNDVRQAILSIKQILNNCLIGKDVDDLALFDIEYLLLTLRAKSIDNLVKFSIKDNETNEKIELELDLNKIGLTKDPLHTNIIKIDEDYVLYLKYPNIDDFLTTVETNDFTQMNYELLYKCLDKLVSKDIVYNFKDFTREEVEEFLNDFSSDNLKDVKQFFETMPKIRHELPYVNKEGKKKTFVIEGMRTFFL